jgi:hypothetical protein
LAIDYGITVSSGEEEKAIIELYSKLSGQSMEQVEEKYGNDVETLAKKIA